jgi:hypothetical protein
MSTPVILRVMERPRPGIPVAIGEAFAIFPDAYVGLEEVGFLYPVWILFGHNGDGDCFADYEVCMTASRVVAPAERPAVMQELGLDGRDYQLCQRPTEEGQVTSAFNDLSCVHDLIDVLRNSQDQGDLSLDDLEYHLDIFLQLIDRSLYRFESQVANVEDHVDLDSDGQSPSNDTHTGLAGRHTDVATAYTGERAIDVRTDEEKQ